VDPALCRDVLVVEQSHAQRMRVLNHLAWYSGCMDVRAYMEEPDWEVMMNQLQFNNVELRDGRYGA